MTPEAQRIAIAEACGYLGFGISDIGLGPTLIADFHPKQDAMGPVIVPDYLTDLNAMHEAEKVMEKSMAELGMLTNTDDLQAYPAWPWYLNVLCKVCGGSSVFCNGNCTIENWHVVIATAAQRAEAFLRTLNLWDDSK